MAMGDNPSQQQGRGVALLEFALAVLVLGVVGSLALGHITHLKAAASIAEAQTQAAQQRSMKALQQARDSLPPCSANAASVPQIVSPSCP